MLRPYPISPIQCQAARSYLGWTQKDLSSAAKIGRTTLCNFEEGSNVRNNTVFKIRATFEKHGIEFIEDDGIKRRNDTTSVYKGYGARKRFFDDLREHIPPEDNEVLCVVKSQEFLLKIFDIEASNPQGRLNAFGLKTKIRCLMPDATTLLFDAPSIQFRAAPLSSVNPEASFVYGNRYALVLREGRTRFVFVVLNASLAAQDYRQDFLSVWEKAEPVPRQDLAACTVGETKKGKRR